MGDTAHIIQPCEDFELSLLLLLPVSFALYSREVAMKVLPTVWGLLGAPRVESARRRDDQLPQEKPSRENAPMQGAAR